jgi:hypothetical protein
MGLMMIEEIKIIKDKNNNYFYDIPFDKLEEWRLKNFLKPSRMASLINIPLRTYYTLKDTKRVGVTLAKKVDTFIKSINNEGNKNDR